MPRLFVALDLPDYAKDAISSLQRGLPDARWSTVDTLHITLAFLGDLEGRRFKEAMHALAEVQTRPFNVKLSGIGHFPPRGPVKQLWVGIQPEPELERLKRSVDRVLDDVGVDVDRRRFVPHVTFARFRFPPPENRMGSFLRRNALFGLPPFIVSDFHLYSSWLGTSPAHYEIEASYELIPGIHNYVD